MSIISARLLLMCLLLHTCSVTSEPDRETCYSRQHRDVTVNIPLALTKKGTVMVPRERPSEKDCILTCCSEDVSQGVKCNLVLYKPPEESSRENCYLFHCPSEQDCPLMTASTGVNTYNIFKGVTYPATKVNGRATAKPATNIYPQLTTTTTPPTTRSPTTTTTTSTTTTTTTAFTTTTSSPTTTNTTTKATESTEERQTVSEATIIVETTPPTTTTIATTTVTTQSTTTTTTQPTTTTTSTTTKTRPPARPAAKSNRPKKPVKLLRGPEAHSVKPTEVKIPTTQPISTTTTQKPATTAPTTTTTTTTAPPTSKQTTVVVLEIESKERALDPDPLLPAVVGSAAGKAHFSRMMWKNSLVAIVVITLIFLVLILALVARKAMESFDRRHYTRLELNDLHYEV